MKNYTPKLKRDTCKVGSGGNKYNVGGKRVDEVILRFDEDEQKFYARIVNPSQHTQYLCDCDKLGLALCKLNTGAAVVRSDLWSRGRVIKTYRPRWRRCRDNYVHVTRLDQEIEITPTVCYLKPPKQHSLEDLDNFFTKIKAILLHDTDYDPKSYRGYKTYCNALAIQVTSTDHIFLRNESGTGQSPYTYDRVDVSQIDDTHYSVTIVNPSNRLQEEINQNHLFADIEVEVKGRYKVGRCQHLRIGDTKYNYGSLTESESNCLQRNRRYKYMTMRHYWQPDLHIQSVPSLTSTITIPEVLYPSHQVYRLAALIKMHGTESMAIDIHVPNIVLLIRHDRDVDKAGCIGRININRVYRCFIDKDNGMDDDPGYFPTLI